MPAATLALSVEQGTTYDVTITFKDGAGALVNLTSYTARMDWRTTITQTVPAITLNTTNGRLTLGGAAGTIRLFLTDSETAALGTTSGASYVYDLELISGGGIVTRLLKGTVTVDPEVTRTT
jgi:hypothetical protein